MRYFTSQLRKISLLVFLFFSISHTAYAYEQAIYIWQRVWNEDVRASIKEIRGNSSHFAVLCGSFSFKNDRPQLDKVRIKWGFFSDGQTAITATIRMDTGIAKLLRDNENSQNLVEAVSAFLGDVLKEASGRNISIQGVQIDYDCPTAKLSDYVKLMASIKKKFPDLQVSFTALPTWLDSADFVALAKSADYYVLQAHSFKVPGTLEEALKPFSGADTFGWVEKASRVGQSYYISLPTYGYEVFFSEKGCFLGLRAEMDPINIKPGTQRAIVATDPAKILEFKKRLDAAKPGFKGIYWFRLPIKSDQFNWSMATLKAVIEGRSPKVSIKTEVISPQPGLYEIYVNNDGEKNIFREINFSVKWDTKNKMAYDVLAGYAEESLSESSAIRIIGPAPKVNTRTLAAWFRIERIDINPLTVGDVAGYEK
jgi:hypothetical protein